MNRLLTCLSVLAATAALSLPNIGIAEPIKRGFDLMVRCEVLDHPAQPDVAFIGGRGLLNYRDK